MVDLLAATHGGRVTHNPYTPPKASLASAHEDVRRVCPRSVNYALITLWLAFALALVNAFYRMGTAGSGVAAAASIGNLAGLGLTAWIYYKIARGRNWARITLLALVCVLALYFATTIYAGWANLPEGVRLVPDYLAIAFMASRFALHFVALYLLFVPGRQWFTSAE